MIFDDVAKDSWYESAVHYVTDSDRVYFNGMNGSFQPNGKMTRGMVVTVLWRMDGSEAVSGGTGFTDVEANQWYTCAVIWAVKNHITDGTSPPTFAPNDNVTREQFATFLYRYATLRHKNTSANGNLSQFADFSEVSDFAWTPLSWANNYGIVTGNGNNICSNDFASRAEVATMIMRFDNNVLQNDIDPQYRAQLNGTTITYSFSTALPGFAEGRIRLFGNMSGNRISLYWGADDKVLVGYSAIDTITAQKRKTQSLGVGENIAIPPEATEVLAVTKEYGTNENRIIGIFDIPTERLFQYGEVATTFGALSDIHVGGDENDSNSIKRKDVALNAMNVLADQGAEMICISGDLTANGYAENFTTYRSLLDNFNLTNPQIPVFACSGNHDNYHLTLTDPTNIATFTTAVVQSPNYTGDKHEEAYDTWGDYVVYTNGCVFLVLNQVCIDYALVGEDKVPKRILTEGQIQWLSEKLNEYRNTSVMLFFHSFFAGTDGDATNGLFQYSKANGTLRIEDEVGKELNDLLLQYPNTVFFNGHSHWIFSMDELTSNGKYTNLNTNVYLNNGGATFVHIPSTTSPRCLTATSAARINMKTGEASEGYLVTVYQDCILLRCMNFLDLYNTIDTSHYYIVATTTKR